MDLTETFILGSVKGRLFSPIVLAVPNVSILIYFLLWFKINDFRLVLALLFTLGHLHGCSLLFLPVSHTLDALFQVHSNAGKCCVSNESSSCSSMRTVGVN